MSEPAIDREAILEGLSKEELLELAQIKFREGYGDHFPTADDPEYCHLLAFMKPSEKKAGE